MIASVPSRTDQQACEIVAGRAFRGRLAAALEILAAAGDRVRNASTLSRVVAPYFTARGPPAQLQATIAADRAIRRRRRIGRPEQRVWPERGLQIRVQHAGFDDREPVAAIDREDPVHALERSDNATRDRIARAGRVGAAPARDDRHAMHAACVHERDHLFVRGRKHDRIGHRFAPRVVVAVDEALGFVGDERVAECRAQAIEQFLGQCHGASPLDIASRSGARRHISRAHCGIPSPACGRGLG